jgi:hypothetical protein
VIVTSAQASVASEAELREAINLLTRHLTERVTAEWDAFDPGPSPAGRETVEERHAPGGCYRLERVKCGKCARCEAGPVHGPYWYWYGRNGGRVVSRYIGKEWRSIDELDGAAQDDGPRLAVP